MNNYKHNKISILLLSILLLLLPCVLLWQPLFRNQSFVPYEMLQSQYPWVETQNDKEYNWNPLQWDGMAQFYVWRDFVWRTERTGHIPLWNPHQFCGTPMLANSQSAPLYPIHILLSWFDTDVGILIAVLFHLWLAGFGAALLLKKMGTGLLSAFVGGAVFQLCGFMVCWLQLPSVPSTIAWYPWLLYFALLYFRKPNMLNLAGLAAGVGLLLLAGHLQFAFYGLLSLFLFVLFIICFKQEDIPLERGDKLKRCLGIAAALLLGMLLAAPQWLPAVELSLNSHRAGIPTSEGYNSFIQLAAPVRNLVTYFLPNFFGTPVNGTYWGQTNYAENVLYVGILPLLLSIYGVWQKKGNRNRWYFAFLIFLSLMAAMGSMINWIFYRFMPGFSSTGSPSRILVLSALGWSLLTGLGLENLINAIRSNDNKNVRQVYYVIFCIIAVAAASYITAAVYGFSVDLNGEALYLLTARELPLSLGVFTLGCYFLIAAHKKYPLGNYAPLFFALLIPTQLIAIGYNYNSSLQINKTQNQNDSLMRLKTITTHRIAAWNTEWNIYETPKSALPPNTATLLDLNDVAGYDSLFPKSVKERLDVVNRQDSAPQENGNMLFVKTPDAAGLAEIGVGYLYSPLRVPPTDWKPIGNGIYQNTFSPKFFSPVRAVINQDNDDMTITADRLTPTKISFIVKSKASVPIKLNVNETDYPGWMVTKVKKTQSSSTGMITLEIPPGESEFELKFQPVSFQFGLFTGLLSLGVLMGLAGFELANDIIRRQQLSDPML